MLRNPSSVTHPYAVVRIDDNDEGFIGYEIWDERPASYHMLCAVYEDPGEDRDRARADANLIVKALNCYKGEISKEGSLAALVLRYVGAEGTSVLDIVKKVQPLVDGVTVKAIYNSLGYLQRKGKIKRIGYGVYKREETR